MNANLMTKKIEMSKTEAKAAGKINSEKFNELNTLHTMYPTFEIEIKASAAKKKSDYKGLTYDYMKKYIITHDDEQKSIMAEFEMLRGTTEEAKEALADSASYKEIKAWFLKKFPAIAKFHEKREAALAA